MVCLCYDIVYVVCVFRGQVQDLAKPQTKKLEIRGLLFKRRGRLFFVVSSPQAAQAWGGGSF